MQNIDEETIFEKLNGYQVVLSQHKGRPAFKQNKKIVAVSSDELYKWFAEKDEEVANTLTPASGLALFKTLWKPLLDRMIQKQASEPNKTVKIVQLYKETAFSKRLLFLKPTNHNASAILHFIGRQKGDVVEVIPSITEEDAKSKILKALQQINPIKFDHLNAKQVYEYLRIDSSSHKVASVHSVLAEGEGEPGTTNYTYCLVPQLQSIENPNIPDWDEFLNRIDDKEAFCAWIWSIFDSKHTGRQFLYLEGQGDDGKSLIQKLIVKKLGERYCAAVDSTSLSAADNHGIAAVVGKRLVYVPDNKNEKLAKLQKVHNITGGDNININPKHEKPFSANVYARLWCNGNITLDLESKYSDLSRVLYLTISQIDLRTTKKEKDWVSGLEAQWMQFLGYCKWCYSLRCNDDRQIRSEKSDASKMEQVEVNVHVWERKLKSVFNITGSDHHYIKASDFAATLREEFKCTNADIRTIKDFLVQVRGLQDFKNRGYRAMIGGVRTWVYRGIRGVHEHNQPSLQLDSQYDENLKEEIPIKSSMEKLYPVVDDVEFTEEEEAALLEGSV